jgi:hypothetical protein
VRCAAVADVMLQRQIGLHLLHLWSGHLVAVSMCGGCWCIKVLRLFMPRRPESAELAASDDVPTESAPERRQRCSTVSVDVRSIGIVGFRLPTVLEFGECCWPFPEDDRQVCPRSRQTTGTIANCLGQ